MINLLSPKQKENLRLEEKFKIILILGLVALSFLVSLILILFSAKIFILADLDIQKINLQAGEAELKNLKFNDLENNIEKDNLVVSRLNSFYQNQVDLTGFLEKISNLLPPLMYFNSLNFDSSSRRFSLSGFAPTREVLLEFKENLEKENNFEEIYFPPANWVTPNDINFDVNFKLQK